MTVSDKIVEELLRKGMATDKYKFRKSISKLLPEKQCSTSIIPDAYKICSNDFCKRVTCYEVEDSNKLTDSKLNRYSELWFELDSYFLDLYLFPVYRDGTIGKEIDLCEKYYSYIYKTFSPKNELVTI